MSKDTVLSVRVTEEQRQRIGKKAAKANRQISTYLRECALDKKITTIEGVREVEIQLRRIGNNLNQLTRLANEGAIHTVDLSEIKQEVTRLWQWLNSCRGAVRSTASSST